MSRESYESRDIREGREGRESCEGSPARRTLYNIDVNVMWRCC